MKIIFWLLLAAALGFVAYKWYKSRSEETDETEETAAPGIKPKDIAPASKEPVIIKVNPAG